MVLEKKFFFSQIGLYNEAIECSDKALKIATCKSNEEYVCDRDPSDEDFIEILGHSNIVFEISKYRRGFLFETNQSELGKIELEAILKGINLKKVVECSNIKLKNAVVYLLCERGFDHINKGEVEDARKLLEQADAICENFSAKFFLGTLYFDVNEYKKSKELCYTIVQSATDAIPKFDALHLLIRICFKEGVNGLPEAKRYICEAKKLFQTDILDFKNLYGERYLCKKLSIMEDELLLFSFEADGSLNETFDVDCYLSKFRNIETEFTEIMFWSDKEKLIPQLITNIYLLLSELYCSVIFRNCMCLDNNNEEYLDSSQEYFDSAMKYIELYPEYRYQIKYNIEDTSFALCNAYERFALSAPNLDQRLRIKYLMKALKLNGQYNFGKNSILYNLGREYFQCACGYYEKTLNGHIEDDWKIGELNSEEAVRYLEWSVRQHNPENDSGKDLSRDERNLAHIMIAYLKYDLQKLGDSVFYFDEVLREPQSEGNKHDLMSFYNKARILFFDVIEVLEAIQMSLQDKYLSRAYKYTADYCRIKFNTLFYCEMGQIKWIYEGDLSEEELKAKITSELKNVENVRVLYKFYKVLVSEGIIKLESVPV